MKPGIAPMPCECEYRELDPIRTRLQEANSGFSPTGEPKVFMWGRK